jgi:hypothetical protein
MLCKAIKFVFVGTLLVAVTGGVLFGTRSLGYFKTGIRRVQQHVHDQVPIEFELQRARNMLNDIIPELQGNIRAIAHDEVEIANLRADIRHSTDRLASEETHISKLRDQLETHTVSFESGTPVSVARVTEKLASRFTRYKEAEMILASKAKLLETRERSLQAALQMFDRAKASKAELEQQVEALVAQHRLIQAQSYTSRSGINRSRLTKADQLLTQIRKRLDVAERVLAHEGEFVGIVEDSPVDTDAVMAEVDEYFSRNKTGKVEVATTTHSDSE